MRTIFATESTNWAISKRIAFRFSFTFFLLYIIFVPSDVLPLYDGIFYPFINTFQHFIAGAAKILLHVKITPVIKQLGDSGGDSAFDYLLYFFIIVLSTVITIGWSYTGRKTANYNRLFYWLLVVLRYFIAFTMIFFGSAKLFRVQFPELTIGRLIERVGDMSPMGLIWTYMSYSNWFNYFTGVAELLCAGLLFFRRTSRLGVSVGIVLLVNIVAINYCFDVPIKLSSTTLLLMCFFMLIPDYRNFYSFFLYNQEAQPSGLILNGFSFTTKWKNITLITVKYTLIFYTVYWHCTLMLGISATSGYGKNSAAKLPLYGLYQVDTFVQNRDTLKPVTTDTTRWSKFWISRPGTATVKLMNDSLKGYIFVPDTVKKSVAVSTYANPAQKYLFHYTIQRPDIMVLEGQLKKDVIYVRMHKIDLNNFRLISRGFHMINEVPYNK